MRSRKAIEATVGLDKHKQEDFGENARFQIVILEVLLDIRELLQGKGKVKPPLKTKKKQ